MKKIKSSIYIAQEKLSTINETNYMTEKDYSRWYADPVEDAKFKEECGGDNPYKNEAVEKARKLTKEQYEACQNIDCMDEELGAENLHYEQVPPESYQIGGTHYVDMKVQPWAVIDTNFDHAQAKGFYRGNALKYIMRAGCKGPAKEDYQKALHYLEKLIEIL